MPESTEPFKCTGCGQPVSDCCGLSVTIAKRVNIKETKEYKELEAKYIKLDEIEKADKMHPGQRREYEHLRTQLKNMRKQPGVTITRRYCPNCAKPIAKALK